MDRLYTCTYVGDSETLMVVVVYVHGQVRIKGSLKLILNSQYCTYVEPKLLSTSKYLEVHTKSVLLIRGTYYQYWLT